MYPNTKPKAIQVLPYLCDRQGPRAERSTWTDSLSTSSMSAASRLVPVPALPESNPVSQASETKGVTETDQTGCALVSDFLSEPERPKDEQTQGRRESGRSAQGAATPATWTSLNRNPEEHGKPTPFPQIASAEAPSAGRNLADGRTRISHGGLARIFKNSSCRQIYKSAGGLQHTAL